MHVLVNIRRNSITAILNDSIIIYHDVSVLPGCIGLISDMPAIFNRVEVKVLKGEIRKLSRKKRQDARREDIHLDRQPKMVNWKKFDTNRWN